MQRFREPRTSEGRVLRTVHAGRSRHARNTEIVVKTGQILRFLTGTSGCTSKTETESVVVTGQMLLKLHAGTSGYAGNTEMVVEPRQILRKLHAGMSGYASNTETVVKSGQNSEDATRGNVRIRLEH